MRGSARTGGALHTPAVLLHTHTSTHVYCVNLGVNLVYECVSVCVCVVLCCMCVCVLCVCVCVCDLQRFTKEPACMHTYYTIRYDVMAVGLILLDYNNNYNTCQR